MIYPQIIERKSMPELTANLSKQLFKLEQTQTLFYLYNRFKCLRAKLAELVTF